MQTMDEHADTGQADLFESAGIVTGLTEEQREAVEFGAGPLLIVAGAGTGKTMVITRRIARLIIDKEALPEQILALTFTEKAAAEMEERVDMLLPYGLANVQISTFHSFGDSLLKQYGLEMGINPDYQVLSQPEQAIFFQEHIFDLPLERYRPLGNPTKFIQHILRVISRAKDEDISPEAYTAFAEKLADKAKQNPDDPELAESAQKHMEVARTYATYQELLIKHGKVDFGDQVFMALKLLRENPSVLSTIRRNIKYILVDEFQDTNFTQYQLVKLLGGENGNITVVGDDDQSIYKFRGAAISNILGFIDDYPSARQVVLTRNFRSTQNILDAAYNLIRNNNPDRLEVKNRINKQLVAVSEEMIPVEQIRCDTGVTEADTVASIIAELAEDNVCSFQDIAVLVRTNAMADAFIRGLNMRNIPWFFSGNKGLYERPEVKVLISFLNVLCDPENSQHLYNLAASELYEIKPMGELLTLFSSAMRQHRSLFSVFTEICTDEETQVSAGTVLSIRKLLKDVAEYQETARDNITGFVLYQFITGSGYLKKLTSVESVENNRKIQNIARFFDVIWSFAQIAADDRVVFFVQHLKRLMDAGDNPPVAEADRDEDAVSISTVHKAKGLEWPVVFMVGLAHSKFPARRKSNTIDLPRELVQEFVPAGDVHMQEERRLFYVGMTRAKQRLYFTSAANYGGKRRQKCSQYVQEALDRPVIDEEIRKSNAVEQIERYGAPSINDRETMAPVPPDTVVNLSYYQIDDYNTCPLKYKYAHILHLPFFHHSIVYGKAVHAAIERYYRHIILNSPVTVDDLYDAYEKAWRNIGFLSREHEERRFEAGKAALLGFFNDEQKRKHDASKILVEESFSFMKDFNRVAGRWDLLEQRDGDIIIADFKTSEVYQQDKADKKAKESMQLAVYALAYEAKYGTMPDRVELRFVESGLVGTAPVTEKMIKKVYEQIETAAAGIRSREYEATPGYQQCRFCAFDKICPSFHAG